MNKQLDAGLPALYSFRRCPYAIRARMVLVYSRINVELREVLLQEMPAAMLACSPKATVPVLVLTDGTVLEESRDILNWALSENDPEEWMPVTGSTAYSTAKRLIDENDGSFKEQLDRYKYAERYPEHAMGYYRDQGKVFLQQLDDRLNRGPWLLGERMTVADVAIFPFVRQFAFVDKQWFDGRPWSNLHRWLDLQIQSDLFVSVMKKYPRWQEGDVPARFP